jgi:hypothetical protein
MQAANTSTSSLREQLTTQPPLMWFSLAFLGGIVLGKLVSLSTWVWIILAVLAIFLSILARALVSRLNPSFLFRPFTFLLFFGLFLGAARYQYSVPKFDAFHIASYNDRDYDLLITGTIAEPPDYRDTYTNLRVQAEKVDTGDGDLPVSGLILIRASNNEIFEYGERIRLRGKLKTPPEN